MKANSIRRLDGQGRVILPSYIRKKLNISKDSAVTIDLNEEGDIVIRPAEERCAICSELLPDTSYITIPTPHGEKHICKRCTCLIKEADECTKSFLQAVKNG